MSKVSVKKIAVTTGKIMGLAGIAAASFKLGMAVSKLCRDPEPENEDMDKAGEDKPTESDDAVIGKDSDKIVVMDSSDEADVFAESFKPDKRDDLLKTQLFQNVPRSRVDSRCVNETAWLILKAIGKGLSEWNEIIDFVKKDCEIDDAAVSEKIKELFDHAIIYCACIKDPLCEKSSYLYQLTPVGIKLYRSHFHAIPVNPEIHQLAHSMNVKLAANVILKNGCFNSVEVTEKEGGNIMPDIICRDGQGGTVYIEYIDKVITNRFLERCRELYSISPKVNLICLNKKEADKALELIMTLDPEKFPKLSVRIADAGHINYRNLNNNREWKAIYIPDVNREPLINY